MFCHNFPKEKKKQGKFKKEPFSNRSVKKTINIDHSHPGVHKIFLKISLNLLLLNKTAENLYPIYLWNNLTIMLKDLTWNNLIRVQSDHESFFLNVYLSTVNCFGNIYMNSLYRYIHMLLIQHI